MLNCTRHHHYSTYRNSRMLGCLILVAAAGAGALLLTHSPLLLMPRLYASLPATTAAADTSVALDGDFGRSLALVSHQLRGGHHLYAFNSSLRLPLLRLNSPAEARAAHRVREAAAWLNASVHVVFAATVRNAMRGLPSTAEQMLRLSDRFNTASFVFLENDSSDGTRKFLADWKRRDPRVRLLGCGGADGPCRLNATYSTGRAHRQGWSLNRSDVERLERGVLMSTFRNLYLDFIYRNLTRPDSLLIVVDADLTFKPWDHDKILQGLYYFRDRPGLHSLCAHTRYFGLIYDPCTLQFFPSTHFSQSDDSEIVRNFRTGAATGPPPVKVDSCFQAFTAYRLPYLAQRRLMYGPAAGETICEHNTLARQLRENYLDFNMRLEVSSQNEGGE